MSKCKFNFNRWQKSLSKDKLYEKHAITCSKCGTTKTYYCEYVGESMCEIKVGEMFFIRKCRKCDNKFVIK